MKKIGRKVARDLNTIFSCAVNALSSVTTRFEGESIMDIDEANFRAEFCAVIRDNFKVDAVEVEVPYPMENSRKCDLVMYSEDDTYTIWIEVKYWGTGEGSEVIRDLEKLQEIPMAYEGRENYRLVLTYWYEDKEPVIFIKSFGSLLGLKQVGLYVDKRFCWFALMPGAESMDLKNPHFCGLSIYLLKDK